MSEHKKNRKQRTLQNAIGYAGIGIHTGEEVSLSFSPAPPDTGIVFRRTDLPDTPSLPASIQYVCDTSRSTTLGVGGCRIHTVEHVLAALKAYTIDNLYIDINSIEPPAANGSSDVFVDLIETAGIEVQEVDLPILYLKTPVYYADDQIQIVALPSQDYRISYTLSYPNSKVLNSQFQSFVVGSQTFKREIAPCRTFSNYQEISNLIDRGLIRGGSLDNAVIIHDHAVYSKGGLFFPDEMVRHKILDMIGDLSLLGVDFRAHIISIRSGHQTNYDFGKKLLETLQMENRV